MDNLGPARTRAPGRRETLSAARRQVLDYLVDAEGGATVADVSRAVGVHPNTAREHLDALVQAGHCVRAQMPAVGRGRPPMVYRAVPSARDVGPEYRVLAEVLVRYVAERWPDRADQEKNACLAGERWVAQLEDDEQRRVLTGAMFDPEPVPGTIPAPSPGTDGAVVLRLRRCPVLGLARRYPGVVCSVHLGLLRGALGDLADDLVLTPFAEAGACVLRLPAGRAAPVFDAGENPPGLLPEARVVPADRLAEAGAGHDGAVAVGTVRTERFGAE